jgi:hypothetical protein
MAIDDAQFEQKFDDLLKLLTTYVKNTDPTSYKNRTAQIRKGNVYSGKDNSSLENDKRNKLSGSHDKLKRTTDVLTDHFTKLGSGSDRLYETFKHIAEFAVLGKTFTTLIDGGINLGKTYNKLSSIGQTFGGSMINMALQAAQAGVPLQMFSELLQRQATVSAVMSANSQDGADNIGIFAKGIRDNLKQFGFYGMNIEQLNDLTADYAETLRKQNLLTTANTKVNQQSIVQFAKDLADFSAVTGKSKEEIQSATNGALGDVSIQSLNLSPQQMQQITQATAGLASLPGDTGTQLSKALVQTIGYGGVQFSDLGKELYSGGMGDVAGILQNYADKVQSGTATKNDLATLVKTLQDEGISKEDFINLQAKAGNADVAQLGTLLFNLRGINPDKFSQDNVNEDNLTKFFNTLENTINSLTTAFDKGFFGTLTKINSAFGNAGDTITNTLAPAFQSLGDLAGNIITTLLSPESIKIYSDFFKGMGTLIKNTFTQDNIKKFSDGFQYLFAEVLKLVGWVLNHPKESIAVGVGTALLAKLGAVALMNVFAGVVNIGGKGIAGLVGLLGKLIPSSMKNAVTSGLTIAKETIKNIPSKLWSGTKTGIEKGASGIWNGTKAGAKALGRLAPELGPEGEAFGAGELIDPLGGGLVAAAGLGLAGLISAAPSVKDLGNTGSRFTQGRGVNPDMNYYQKMYNDTITEISKDKQEDKTATGQKHLELLKQIAMLTEEQLKLQKALGIQTITQQQKTTKSTQQVQKAVVRAGT